MEELRQIPTMPLIKLDTRYKMVIPSSVEQKIRHLCNRVWDKEWSGVLFYKTEGSFEDKSLVITCVDIFIMDIGSAAYTEFDMSPDVVAYMTEHSELMECQMGLIHSHDTMPTFFSGTDIATLKDIGRDMNHFVSLIVNNAGSYTAAITRKVKSSRIIHENFSYESFEGNPVEATDSWEEEVEELQYFMLDITNEGNNCSFLDIDARLAEIKKGKEVKAKTQEQGTIIPKAKEIEGTAPFNKDEVVSEHDLKADPHLIHSLCLQLLTGSVMIPRESKIDIKNWVTNLGPIVEKRFGTGKVGLDDYKSFIETFTEFIVWNTDDSSLRIIDKDYMMVIIASDMLDYISTLPQNIYTKICKDALSNYTL